MTKFTKITATAIFAVFLTACDKPAQKTEAKAETPAATQPATKVEETKPATAQASQQAETTKSEAAPATQQSEAAKVDAEGAADFKKVVEWNQAQEKGLAEAQNALQQKLATQDKTQIEEGLKAFKVKVDEVLKSLDALEVKNADVANFKAKTKETLTLSNELIAESVKAMTAPTAELQNVIQEKTQKLMQSGADLQKLQAELQAKFGMK